LQLVDRADEIEFLEVVTEEAGAFIAENCFKCRKHFADTTWGIRN
jgi:hypothetical protein